MVEVGAIVPACCYAVIWRSAGVRPAAAGDEAIPADQLVFRSPASSSRTTGSLHFEASPAKARASQS